MVRAGPAGTETADAQPQRASGAGRVRPAEQGEKTNPLLAGGGLLRGVCLSVCHLQEKVQDNQWLRAKVLSSLKAEVRPEPLSGHHADVSQYTATFPSSSSLIRQPLAPLGPGGGVRSGMV